MRQTTVPRRRTILLILDGVGVNPSKKFNAVHEANTPKLDSYFGRYPHTTLQASGRAVGLPDGQMGNSEVGHMTIGCGMILKQDLVRIDDAIEDGSFARNHSLINAINNAKRENRPLHLLGLVSDGGVHSHLNHLIALLKACMEHNVKPVLHVITDGRDTAPNVAKSFLRHVLNVMDMTGGEIATITGRFYAMDRDNRWERTKVAWDAMVHGIGTPATDAMQAVDDAYAAGETDEFIKPRILPNAERIQSNDSVLFFNFRNDRPRQTAKALADENFDGFERGDFEPVSLTTMTEYDKRLLAPVIFPPERPATNLAQIISLAGLKQLHCAETEKYAHVTFFFNGGRERTYAGEERVVIPSPKVETYDQQPEMSAKQVADTVIDAIENDKYCFIVANFANGDMVGHTAIRDAIIQAVEVLDHEAGRVLDAAIARDYSVIVTADHGNCDEYVDPLTGGPNPQHTVYPVPCLIIDKSNWRLSTEGGLSNLAPTVLHLMGLPKPDTMKGKTLLLEEIPLGQSAVGTY
ncbi:2,3-bisphosphoglycerate-independent phosphoglycerate mutase [Thiothrix unzii]|jgi:2,3-bisphosphoglycerate-independent phosphoglycerate mutase|uniref:2,3-bisphosphoglycerate-independent phosphoglycerate mutase n=1 Tax=Thiothrix unzii TaxID=111769 RepID=A0A975F9Q7_9GAMM|nr:2,3-bisphosphoglycerate-independent phosphoglycerate mutase [Thiothrix unzii]MDX9987599.1 2,3-bisphosphoglycerate-independent phosphoglycerate mutase [Thiothrix unzii]QTR52995.1 2,3-bisphosphoglycerate-independent phosphoglycerate mutase [Thiothrix unzii]